MVFHRFSIVFPLKIAMFHSYLRFHGDFPSFFHYNFQPTTKRHPGALRYGPPGLQCGASLAAGGGTGAGDARQRRHRTPGFAMELYRLHYYHRLFIYIYIYIYRVSIYIYTQCIYIYSNYGNYCCYYVVQFNYIYE